MPAMNNRRGIAIVGGGFCGTVLAVNLLRHPPAEPTEVSIVERGAEIGRGVAYAIHDCPHLLNVPAGRLSADSRDPQQFIRFARRTLPEADGEDFLPRQLYGDYLQDLLARAEHDAPAHVALTRVCGEATGISGTDADACLGVLIDGRAPLSAHQVVLAPGNPPPPRAAWAEPVRDHPAYHEDPWRLPLFHGAHSVLIVGNGLTMADVVGSLSQNAADGPRLTTISRHGLLPLPQSTFHAAAVQGGPVFLQHATSIREVLAAGRSMAREVTTLGGDWREVVTFIRHWVPSIWQQLPPSERRRFLRHAQRVWDVHRHRMPPILAERIDALRRSGRLAVNAGRIQSISPEGRRLRVQWRPRGGSQTRSLVVDAVINAMGPEYDIERARNVLLQSLRAAGRICADELRLGLRTGVNGECVDSDGALNARLFYLGPMLRAQHWEATAAAELRNHAEHLARHLAGATPGQGRGPSHPPR